jgi:acyl-CoA thioesterase-1
MSAFYAPAMAGTVATKRIVVFGDSLSAGYGLAAADALPAQLEKRLRASGLDVVVVNAGVSGDTTATGVERLDYTLGGEKFDVAIIELGANDMLRGLDPKAARANIEKMILAFRGKGTEVILAVMVSSDNWGQTYKKEFDSIYPELASRYSLALAPFMMAGVWGDPKLLIGDGLHPNAAGVAHMTDVLAPSVQKLLARMTSVAPVGK